MTKPPTVIVDDLKTYRAEDVPEEFLEAIAKELEPLPEHCDVIITHDIATPDGLLPRRGMCNRSTGRICAPPLTKRNADWPPKEFANATPEQRDAMIEMVRQAGRSIRGYWMGEMLGWGTVEYEDMTPEQQRIVDAGDEIAGQFPEGLTKEQLSTWIKDRFLTVPDRPPAP